MRKLILGHERNVIVEIEMGKMGNVRRCVQNMMIKIQSVEMER
jgi:hypothetical protein